MRSENYVRLAERLNSLAPGDFAHKTIFFTTGAEATENSVKIARAFTGRPAVISFKNSFHGRTLLGMTLPGKAGPFKQNFGPFAPEIYHAPFPNPYHGCSTRDALKGLAELFDQQIPPGQVAAAIIEPVQGEGGFLPAPPDFMLELRWITEQNGILLIADEIQTGFGRTGKLFAIEHYGIAPGLLTVAKSLAGGLPLSGVTGRAEVMDAPAPGGLGGTYGGNPLACAAGLAVLDILEEENLLEKADRLGQRLKDSFEGWQRRFARIGQVRGLSAMQAMEFVRDPLTKEPAPELVNQILAKGLEKGLMLVKAGLHGNVLRVLVPLVIEDALLEKALSILGEVIEDTLGPATNRSVSR